MDLMLIKAETTDIKWGLSDWQSDKGAIEVDWIASITFL